MIVVAGLCGAQRKIAFVFRGHGSADIVEVRVVPGQRALDDARPHDIGPSAIAERVMCGHISKRLSISNASCQGRQRKGMT
jgi:hypothetical protein